MAAIDITAAPLAEADHRSQLRRAVIASTPCCRITSIATSRRSTPDSPLLARGGAKAYSTGRKH
jgi:hypothetical protein